MPTSENDYLNRAEVQSILRCSMITALKLIHEGAFPNAVKLGRQYRIPRGDVDAYLRQQRLNMPIAAAS